MLKQLLKKSQIKAVKNSNELDFSSDLIRQILNEYCLLLKFILPHFMRENRKYSLTIQ